MSPSTRSDGRPHDERDGAEHGVHGDDRARQPEADYVDVRRRVDGRVLAADPEFLRPRLRGRRALVLVLLTLVAPGSAQLVAGNRRAGAIALRIWVATLITLALTAVVFFLDRALLLNVMSNSLFLTGLAAVLGAAAIGWTLLFLDALRISRPRLLPGGSRAGVAAITALLVAVTALPLGLGARNVLAGRDLVSSVFGNHTSRQPSNGRYNILLLGGDSGASRTGTRPDTIMLASVDADTGKSVLFGFSRETENINFRPGSTMARLMPQGWNCGDECLLNGIYRWAMEHHDQFPADVADPGALATKEAVEALSGLDIQYYGLVDLRGFQRFVDAVGGIDIYVGKRTPIGGGTSPISGYIEPGQQHLDGYHALWYARSREGSSNYERMARQRCVISAMVHQLSPETVFLKFQEIASVSGSVLQTDIPEGDVGTLGDLALKSRGHKMTSVNFVPPIINPWDYDPQVIRSTVERTIEASESEATPSASAASGDSGDRAPDSGSTTDDSESTGTAAPGSAPTPTGASEDLSTVCSAS
ncbi:LCP family protein [Piscicoccus intestinalis]|uniref:LCP family protein n=1 Tax=Piscicoccus intestinalis TaxID=746033 RepID=UPI0009FD73AB|nr:LCP family protein [Piscicoccus intestinalis]